MPRFQIKITRIGSENHKKKVQIDVNLLDCCAPRTPPAFQPEASVSSAASYPSASECPYELPRLASFQLLEYTSYLINIFKIPHPPQAAKEKDSGGGSVPPAKAKDGPGKCDRRTEKILEMLHFAGEGREDATLKSNQDIHAALNSLSGHLNFVRGGKNPSPGPPGQDKNPKHHNLPHKLASTTLQTYGLPLKTVIINLEDWKSNNEVTFNLNTAAWGSQLSETILIPFEENTCFGNEKKTPSKQFSVLNTIFDFFGTAGAGTDPPSPSGRTPPNQSAPPLINEDFAYYHRELLQDPFRMHVLVGNTLLFMIQGSKTKLYPQELNNNDDLEENEVISSAKALYAERKAQDLSSENALTDDGIPLVPTKKQIIQELVRERLRSLGMDTHETNVFLEIRDSQFVSLRSLSVRLPVLNTPNSTPRTLSYLGTGSGSKKTSTAFEIQVRFESLSQIATSVKQILDSATVSAIESSIYFIIPHLTVSSVVGSRKPSTSGPSLVDDWLEILFTTAYQLRPAEGKQIGQLIEHEFRILAKATETWMKTAKETLAKLRKLNSKAIKKYRKATLPKYHAATIPSALAKSASTTPSTFPLEKTDAGYSGFLHKMGVSAQNLYLNHMYLSVGRHGLMFKKNLRDSWFPLESLSYPERRGVFFGLIEYMLETVRNVTTVVQSVQELGLDGYPANIYKHLKVVFQLTSELNYGFTVPLDVANAVPRVSRSIMESFARLLSTLNEVYTMAKVTHAKFSSSYYDHDDAQRFKGKKSDPKSLRVQMIVPLKYLALDGVSSLKLREHIVLDDKSKSRRIRERLSFSKLNEPPLEKQQCLF